MVELTLHQTQHAMGEFVRGLADGKSVAMPQDRLMIYQELVQNNFQSMLGSAFPVLSRVLPEETWQTLIRQFYQQAVSTTPLFYDIPVAFLQFLQQQADLHPAYALELAHFEWAEMAIEVSTETTEVEGLDKAGDVLTGRPVISPVLFLLTYRYPVHLITESHTEVSPGEQPYCYALWRQCDFALRTEVISAAFFLLLQQIQTNPELTGEAHIQQWIQAFPIDQHAHWQQEGAKLLNMAQEQDMILGIHNRR